MTAAENLNCYSSIHLIDVSRPGQMQYQTMCSQKTLKHHRSTYMRNRNIRRAFKYRFYAFALVMFIICTIFFFSKLNAQASAPVEQMTKCYAKVQIVNGDSLWSIAEDYTDGSVEAITSCIKETKSINHIGDYETIKAGDTILVPYYL